MGQYFPVTSTVLTQTWAVRGHAKNRWSLDSIAVQNAQEVSKSLIYLDILSFVGSLSRWASQLMKLCLGTTPLNQTQFAQTILAERALIAFQVEVIEKIRVFKGSHWTSSFASLWGITSAKWIISDISEDLMAVQHQFEAEITSESLAYRGKPDE